MYNQHQKDNDETITHVNIETKSINNICYEVVENFFEFLDVESLLNVAGTCKRLQNAAVTKFSYDFGKMRTIIAMSYVRNAPFVRDRNIHVYGMKYSLPFLRSFGAKISNLSIWNQFEPPVNTHLMRYLLCMRLYGYINKYCATTLTNLSIYDRSFPMGIFAKPFTKVEKLEIFSSSLTDGLFNIGNIFPNLCYLEICFIQKLLQFFGVLKPFFRFINR